MEDPHNWCSRNASFLWEMECWFSEGFLKALSQILNILRNDGWTMSTTVAFVGICHTSCLPKFGHQTLNCPYIRYIGSVKKISCIVAASEELILWLKYAWMFFTRYWIVGIVSSWIYVSVKIISQGCCLYHLINIKKKS